MHKIKTFCKTNHTLVEFVSEYFLVKDLSTREILSHELNYNDVYERPSNVHASPLQCLATVIIYTSSHDWYKHLGHPSTSSFLHLIKCGVISSSSTSSLSFFYESYQCNTSHKLPFGVYDLMSCGPLNLIDIDVWGLAFMFSIDDFRYYLIFVNHFIRYIWLYPMKNKKDVSLLSPTVKNLVKNYIHHVIVSIYLVEGGKNLKLEDFFYLIESSTYKHIHTHMNTMVFSNIVIAA